MPRQERLYFLDNLRSVVILLVIVLHASLTYMVNAPSWWYVLDPLRSSIFDLVVILTDVPIMLVLFFLAGHFAYPSLERRGPGDFMRDKGVRIGLPWAVGALLLAPPIAYMIYFSRDVPVSFWQFWAVDFWGPMFQQGVYWYLGVLFFFYALLAASYDGSERLRAWQHVPRSPSWKHFLGFWGLMTAGFFCLSLFWTPDAWRNVILLVYQPVRVPLYIGYFIFGMYAERSGWFAPDGYQPSMARWLPLFLASGVVYALFQLLVTPSVGSAAPWQRAITAVLFNAFCLSALMAGLSVFRRFVNDRGRTLRSLARNSYGIYYVHPLILYPLAYLFVPLSLSTYAKAVALIVLTVMMSWSFSELVLTRAPGLRKAFGSG